MINKKVKVPFRKLKHIHHISDIQIRNLKRHKEYNEVFERTYEEIRKNKDNSVVYIGGDIAHSKTDMSPELIQMLSDLFVNLADICPTILIAGNHDCNLNNRSRLDVLSPIVNNLQHPNLHYFKNTGVYKVADVSFVVWDCWDDEKDFILAKDVEGDTKVVLFHGTVDSSKTDLGYHLPSDVKISKFKGYDLGLLGDIHKRQFLNRKKTIGYCGSLVQQNHGEGLSHGYLLWDVPKRKSKYIEIPNDYGYYTLDIENGNVPKVDDMPKKARLRLRVSDTTPSDLKKALTYIHSEYGVHEITINKVGGITTEKVRGQTIEVGDIGDTDYQFSLISEYLEQNYAMDEETLLRVKKINEEINSQVPEEQYQRNVNYKLKTFEFDNMFSYGEGNKVDFTKLNGIVGLFASNASGKSSLLDALSFCLFDTSSKAFKADSVLNTRKDTFHCKVNFEIDGQDYFIERTAKTGYKGHVKVDVNFWTIDDSDEVVSLNGDQRRTTNVNIRKVIGTYEDFVLTAMSLQNNFTVFIDKTQKERKDLLAQFMGISIFDKLYVKASEESQDVRVLLKNFKQTDYEIELNRIKDDYKIFNKTLKELKSEREELKVSKDKIDTKIKTLMKDIQKVDTNAVDIDSLKEEKRKLVEYVDSSIDTVTEFQGSLSLLSSTEKQLQTQILIYNKEKTNENYAKLIKLEEDKSGLKVEIDKLKIEVRNKLDKLEKLGDLEYDSECSYCMSNPFTLDAIETKDKLQSDRERAGQLVKSIDSVDDQLIKSSIFRNKKEELESKIIELEGVRNEIEKSRNSSELLEERIDNSKERISSVESKISQYYIQKETIESNKKIEDQVDQYTTEFDNQVYQLDMLDQKITDLSGEIQVLKSRKKEILNNIKKVEELEDKYQAYEYYLDSVKRDGVPYELISKSLPTIEGAVNEILAQIVDFSIIFEMDGKNINNYIVYDDDRVWPLELSSGMEKFLSSLSMRVGLMSVSNLPMCNFLAIDEGWGTMDSDNLNSVYNLFQYLKTQFQFTLIVSHIDTMRDAVDTLLEIKKEEGFSSVKN